MKQYRHPLFVLLFLSIFFVSFTSTAFTQETIWDLANSPQYGKKVGGMLGRGLLNIATSFVDLIVHTVEATKEGPPFVGTLTGLGSGIGCSSLRVTSGALDVITFWVPGFNGFPVSRSYSNCLEYPESEKVPQKQVLAPPVPSQPVASSSLPQVVSAPPPKKAAAPKTHNPLDYVKK